MVTEGLISLCTYNVLLKMGHRRPLFLYFRLYKTVGSVQIFPITEFEPRTSGVGSDCSANWGTTTAHLYPMFALLICANETYDNSCSSKSFDISSSVTIIRTWLLKNQNHPDKQIPVDLKDLDRSESLRERETRSCLIRNKVVTWNLSVSKTMVATTLNIIFHNRDRLNKTCLAITLRWKSCYN